MKTNSSSKFCFFNSRAAVAFALSSAGVLLAMLAFANPRNEMTRSPAELRGRSPAHETPTINSDWSIVPSPNYTGNDTLFSIACPLASRCWAVGGQYALIEKWDGTSWTIVSTTGHNTAQLLGVACVSATACWAVGYDAGGGGGTVLEQWDGVSWTMVSAFPNSGPILKSVTCPGASDCWAVGSVSNALTAIEHWDGMSWTVVPSPNPNPNWPSRLEGVTCTSSSDCWAVGLYYDFNQAAYYKTLVEHWDGRSWTIVPSPNATAYDCPHGTAAPSGQLYGVTCSSASGCWAVGQYFTCIGGIEGDYAPTLIERWDGNSWTIVASPNVNSILNNNLNSVACTSASQCFAVGTLNNGGTAWVGPLLEQWDGTSWSIASWPGSPLLHGVTCIAGPECWAVGWNGDGFGGTTVIGHYPALTAAFFMGEIPLSNGAYYLQFPNGTPFGYYSYLTDPRFIYHFDMGYEYWFDANDGHNGIYFYDFMSNHFFYTSPSFPFPYLYDFSLNSVLYYYPDSHNPGHYTTNPRYFYNFATGQIITM